MLCPICNKEMRKIEIMTDTINLNKSTKTIRKLIPYFFCEGYLHKKVYKKR